MKSLLITLMMVVCASSRILMISNSYTNNILGPEPCGMICVGGTPYGSTDWKNGEYAGVSAKVVIDLKKCEFVDAPVVTTSMGAVLPFPGLTDPHYLVSKVDKDSFEFHFHGASSMAAKGYGYHVLWTATGFSC